MALLTRSLVLVLLLIAAAGAAGPAAAHTMSRASINPALIEFASAETYRLRDRGILVESFKPTKCARTDAHTFRCTLTFFRKSAARYCSGRVQARAVGHDASRLPKVTWLSKCR